MTKYETGLVSVIMPTYKRTDKLTRAIESVLNQSYRNLELLLINDNEPNDEYSTTLVQVIRPYLNDNRFKLVLQDKHVNGAVARNVGIRQAKGEFIAFLDDDDWWEIEKIEHQINELNQLDSTWGGVSCRFTLYDNNGHVIGKSQKYKDGYIYKDILYLLSDVATGTLLLRHDCLDKAGYFDENLLRHQDLQLLIDFTVKYKLHEVNEFLHCVDVSDAQNRPDPIKLITFKSSFFDSIQPVMNTLSVREKKEVAAMHRFELGYVYLINNDYAHAFNSLVSVLCVPSVIPKVIRKTINRFRQSFSR